MTLSESEKKLETRVMGPGLNPNPDVDPPAKSDSLKVLGGREMVGRDEEDEDLDGDVVSAYLGWEDRLSSPSARPGG